MQGIVDARKVMGEFILTGSQQFGLMAGITQTLAGRAALVDLMPFSIGELKSGGILQARYEDLLFTGCYPPVYDRDLAPDTFYGNYVRTYLEREVRQVLNIRDLSAFGRFLRLCAGRTGQIVNLSSLGSDAGISYNTAKEWISVLQTGFLVHLLAPYHRNFNKRITKTPKLYFLDSGLACWLLGIQEVQQVQTHPLRGALFETMVVAELLKLRLNAGKISNLYFWRSHSGLEVDVLIEQGSQLIPVEIKSGKTIASDWFDALHAWRELAGSQAAPAILIHGGRMAGTRNGIEQVPWDGLERIHQHLR